MANPSNFQITPWVALVEDNEINFRSLYLHQITHGPNQNQSTIIDLNNRRGTTAVNNWPVYDGPGPNAKVVARAQGLHIYAGNGNWHNTFSLVFEHERFKGSTLQVMGISATEVKEGEWAIVGGTGKFDRATGVISKKPHEKRNDGGVIDLAIHAFCPLTKIGPWGGNRSTFRDIREAPRRLESITVRSRRFKVVYSIEFSYIDHDGEKRNAGPWGRRSGGEHYTIQLASSEFVKEVSGTFGKYKGYTVITSLKFVTNDNKTRGHFGDYQNSGQGTRFSVPVQDSKVVGFFGRGRKHYLHAVGVYVRPF